VARRGLSVVVSPAAGPFNLGNVIVRVGLHIDPNTAQVTATSSPFPQIIDGVPLRIRTVNVTLNNSAFTFNPCHGLSEDQEEGQEEKAHGAQAAQSKEEKEDRRLTTASA
jgi:hypothetical protein